MASSSRKTMFFKDYSLLAVFDAYLRRRCTIPDIYTCICAGLVVIRSLRTALGLLKEERKKKKKKKKKKEDEQFAWAAILFLRLETSVSLAKGIFKLRNIA